MYVSRGELNSEPDPFLMEPWGGRPNHMYIKFYTETSFSSKNGRFASLPSIIPEFKENIILAWSVLSCFRVIFLFFFAFWQPKFGNLRRKSTSDKAIFSKIEGCGSGLS